MQLIRDVSHLEDLRPAVAEPTISNHETLATRCELARYSLHAVGAATGNHYRGFSVVNLFQHAGDVIDHPHERFRHMVQRTIGVHHRKLE